MMKYAPLILPNDSFMVNFSPFCKTYFGKEILCCKFLIVLEKNGIKNFIKICHNYNYRCSMKMC